MIRLSQILVPTDFSPHASAAVRYAAQLADSFDAEISLLHIVDSTVVYAGEIDFGACTTGAGAAVMTEQQATDLLNKVTVEGITESRIRRTVVFGTPAETICRIAEEQEADMVVLGTHGRTGLARVVLGSVAEHVVRLAPCPVLTVRLPEE